MRSTAKIGGNAGVLRNQRAWGDWRNFEPMYAAYPHYNLGREYQ
jgi:hypothetical protein